jgi:parvulin-like peptidyl-prolyl isomerase
MSFPFRILCAATCLALLAACGSDKDESRVVARVNDRPITLQELELKHDFMHLTWSGDVAPSVARLKSEYGQVLGELVVLELVAQELEDRGLAVTPEEVAAAEAVVRADYPEDAFEEVLVEEYIDLNYWRAELKDRLTLEKFFAEVLRPGVSLSSEEAEAYYREHVADFYLPPRIRFVHINGPTLDVVESATQLFRSGKDLAVLAEKFKQVTAQELKLREDRLTAAWQSALKNLEPGQASPVLTGSEGFERLIMIDKSPAKVLDPPRAYPLVEKVLVEQKLRVAFEEWLTSELSRAEIRITPHLLRPEEGGGEDEEPAMPQAPPAEDSPAARVALPAETD